MKSEKLTVTLAVGSVIIALLSWLVPFHPVTNSPASLFVGSVPQADTQAGAADAKNIAQTPVSVALATATNTATTGSITTALPQTSTLPTQATQNLTPVPIADVSAPLGGSANVPRLTVTEPVKELGDVKRGEKLNWTFEVNNAGSVDLEILDAKPFCRCTVATFTRVIKPGQTGEVIAQVDTSAFVGPISKVIEIVTNDPVSSRIQLTIKASVNP